MSLYSEETLWIALTALPVRGSEEPRALVEFIAGKEGTLTRTVDPLFVSDDGTLAVWKIITDMWHQYP